VFAFARAEGRRLAVTCVPRLVASIVPDQATPPNGGVWGDTRLVLPEDAPSAFSDAFTGDLHRAEGADGVRTLAVATLLERFPVGLALSTGR
jgi:maltooligosyltrehalose synthase